MKAFNVDNMAMMDMCMCCMCMFLRGNDSAVLSVVK